MNKTNPFNDTINHFKNTSDKIDEITRKEAEENNKETSDSKKNEAKDENKDPTYILYNSISNTIISLLQSNEVLGTFKKISDATNLDVSKSMIEMMAILMTQSSYQAILLYDSMLTERLNIQFDNFVNAININKADIDGHHNVLKVFKKRLGDIEKTLKLGDFVEKNNISEDPNN